VFTIRVPRKLNAVPPAWTLDEGPATLTLKRTVAYEMSHRTSELDGFFGTT